MTKSVQATKAKKKKETIVAMPPLAQETVVAPTVKPVESVDEPIKQTLDLLSQMNLKSAKNQRAVLDLKKHYQANEVTFLFTTMMLFAKKNMLTDESFGFLRSAMNIIEHIYNLMNSLFNFGILNKPNLNRFIGLPALKEANAMFDLLDLDEEQPQQSFDETIASTKPITESISAPADSDERLKEVLDALLRCVDNHVDREALLQIVKAHPFPQKIASALIALKQQGIELSSSMIKPLLESDNPNQLIDSLLEKFQSGASALATPSTLKSLLGYAASGAKRLYGFFASPSNEDAEHGDKKAHSEETEQAPSPTIQV